VQRQCLPAVAPVSGRSARSPGKGGPSAIKGDPHRPFFRWSDWGGAGHAVCIIDEAGKVVHRIEAQHTADGPADILRTDRNRLRPLMPASDEIHALRALVRGRDDLVAQRVALANQ